METKFNLAQTLVEDLSELVDDFSTDEFIPIEYESGEVACVTSPDSILDLSQLKMDFQIVRQNIMKVVAAGNRILDGVSVLDLDDLKPSHLMALAQLQTALGSNISLLLNSYKDIAAIEKSRVVAKPKPNEVPNVSGNLTQNNITVYGGSTAELLSIINGQKVDTLIDV